MKPLCIFHRSDLDGACSAAIVLKRYPQAELWGYDYGDDNEELLKAAKDRDVIMVDASLQPHDKMRVLLKQAAGLTWIDHHKGVLEWANKHRFNPKGLREDGRAGCELTWEYFFKAETTPRAVTLLGRYDVFDTGHKDWASRIEPFQYGMRGIPSEPDAGIWKQVLSDRGDHLVANLIGDGKIILHYQLLQDEKAAEGLAFEVEFEGLRAVAANSGGKGSQFFKSVYDSKVHDLMLTFFYSKKGHWTVGLYSTHDGVDCCKLAERHSGSGHKGAAGFECSELPFKLGEQNDA